MANLQRREEWYVGNEHVDYIIERMPPERIGVSMRELYRILNPILGEVHYKSIYLGGLYIATERAKGKAVKQIFDEIFKKYIENLLISGNEENIEVEVDVNGVKRKDLYEAMGVALKGEES